MGERRSLVPDHTALLVVNYRSAALLDRNLAPLTRDRRDLSVVIVDNRSTDEERRTIEAAAQREGWTFLPLATNVGFGEGMNRAAEVAIAAGAGYLLLLNPDASIDGDSVDLLRAAAGQRNLVGPTIARPDGSIWSAGSDLHLGDGRVRGRRRRGPEAEVMEWLTGACLMLTTELWRAIEGFDPNYYLYWEDVDLSWKVHHVGGRVVLEPRARAIHDPGGTQDVGRGGTRAKSDLYYYFNIRNRLVFAALRLSPDAERRWRRRTLAVAIEVLLIGGRRQLLRSSGPVRVAARGWWDGRRLAAAIRTGRPSAVPARQARLVRGTGR